MKKVAILGCGHGGMALAADLKLKGAEVAIWSDPKHETRLNKVREDGGIIFQTKDDSERFIKLDLLSNNLEEIISFGDILYNCTPMTAHVPLFNGITSYLAQQRNLKYLINLSGTFSGIDQYINNNDYSIFEKLKLFDASTFPYACRAGTTNDVKIFGTKNELPIAPLFPSDARYLTDFPDFTKPTKFNVVKNSFKLGLMGSNAVFHPATVILNARLVDNGQKFLFYKEGVSKKTAVLHEALDSERLLLAKVMNYELTPFVDDDNRLYNTSFANNYDFCVNSEIHKDIVSPTTLNHRFITEDVAYGLVPLSALSKLFKVNLINIESVINIFSTIMGVNYYQQGRNLTGLTRRQIEKFS